MLAKIGPDAKLRVYTIDNVQGYKLYLAIVRGPYMPGSNYSICQNLHVSMHGPRGDYFWQGET